MAGGDEAGGAGKPSPSSEDSYAAVPEGFSALAGSGASDEIHPTMSIPEVLLTLAFASLLMWAPVFGFAYARRQFGGEAKNYLKAYLAVSAATVAAFVLLAIIESALR